MCAGVCACVQVCVGGQVCAGVCRCVCMCAGVCRCVQVYVGACRCVYMCRCVCVCVREVLEQSKHFPPPTIKNGSCLNVRISVTSKVSSKVFSISETKMVPVHDYEKDTEAFAITKIRTSKHEPFFIVGGGGGGAYSWNFTVINFH